RRLAVDLRELHELARHEVLERAAELGELRRGERHEAPVVLPGVVEDAADRRHLFLETRLLDPPPPHPPGPAPPPPPPHPRPRRGDWAIVRGGVAVGSSE